MEPNDQPSPYPYLISVRGSRPVAARRDGSYYVCAYQVQLGLWWAARDVTVLEYDPSRNFYREQRQAYLASHPEAVTDPIAIAPHEASPEVAGPATPESSGRAEPDPTAATAPATPPPVGGSVSQDERPAPTDGVPVEAELPRVWFLTAEELAATQAKVAALRKRAARKGFTGQIDLAAVPATRTYQSAGGLPVTEHGFDVTITGEPPRYAGWRFVAAVDAVEGGTIVRYPPGSTTTIANDQIRAGQCDHCHTRRARRSTVLVTHEDTGHLLQVGRTCLKDFLGHSATPVLLTEDDVRAALRGGTSSGPAQWDVHSVLTYACAAVDAFGWTPAAAAGNGRTPTRDVVALALAGGRGADQLRTQLAPHLDQATTRATQIRNDLLAGLAPRSTSGYEANLLAVLRGDAVEARHLGLAVSAIVAHQRLLCDHQRETAPQQTARTIDYAGTVGEKVTLTGTVRTAIRVDGYTHRSPDNVLLVVDCGTAVAKTTTAAGWAYSVKVGDQVTITGTVKAHTEWNGIRQTVLTRPAKHAAPEADATLTDAPAPAAWQIVAPPRLNGAQMARRALVRTPARDVQISR